MIRSQTPLTGRDLLSGKTPPLNPKAREHPKDETVIEALVRHRPFHAKVTQIGRGEWTLAIWGYGQLNPNEQVGRWASETAAKQSLERANEAVRQLDNS